MKKLNFFIVGAPKCGTTSMATWLSEHQNIYMSPIKEPHYFSTDCRVLTHDLKSYEKLFESAGKQHIAIGEASVWYLYSKVAIRKAIEYSPSAKFIAMLRNPVDMAYSMHNQWLYGGNEHIEDFKTAWHLQNDREQGKSISRLCRCDPQLLVYGKICKLGEQIDSFFRLVPESNRLVLLLDDIKQNPSKEYNKVLQFLGVPNDNRSDFSIHNRAKIFRVKSLQTIVRVAGKIKQIFGIKHKYGFLKQINLPNIVETPRSHMETALRNEIIGWFRQDIELLSAILQRDLKHWLK